MDRSSAWIHDFAHGLHDECALAALRIYYSRRLDDNPRGVDKVATEVTFRGEYFDQFGEDLLPGQITAEDVIAVSMLSVPYHARWAAELLHNQARAARIGDLLEVIPHDQELRPQYPENDEWPAWGLREELLKIKGIGGVTASKLMARKRPFVVPIYDAVVDSMLGGQGQTTVPIWHAFREIPELAQKIDTLVKTLPALQPLSPLRVFDVITWMHGKYGCEWLIARYEDHSQFRILGKCVRSVRGTVGPGR